MADDLAAGRLVWPFDHCLPTAFAYHVVSPRETAQEGAIAAFRDRLLGETANSAAVGLLALACDRQSGATRAGLADLRG